MKKIIFLLVFLSGINFLISSCKSDKKENQNENIIVLNNDNFDEEIANGVVMVDFWASWCMPCRTMSPIIDDIATQTKGKVKVGKVDVDSNGDLARRFNVQGIPNILIFKNGIEVENLVGVQSKTTIMQLLDKQIGLQN